MHAVVHAADVQDRDGGLLVMATLFGLYPFLLKLYADSGYAGTKFQAGLHGSAAKCTLRSSAGPTGTGFWSCRNAGSSNAPSPGSTGAGGWQRTGSA